MKSLDDIMLELKSHNININVQSIPSLNYLEEQKSILVSGKKTPIKQLIIDAIEILIDEAKKKKNKAKTKNKNTFNKNNKNQLAFPYYYYPWGGWWPGYHDHDDHNDHNSPEDEVSIDSGSSDSE